MSTYSVGEFATMNGQTAMKSVSIGEIDVQSLEEFETKYTNLYSRMQDRYSGRTTRLSALTRMNNGYSLEPG